MEVTAEGSLWFIFPALPGLETGPDAVTSVYVCLDLSLFHIKAGILNRTLKWLCPIKNHRGIYNVNMKLRICLIVFVCPCLSGNHTLWSQVWQYQYTSESIPFKAQGKVCNVFDVDSTQMEFD